jgi:hypothetical protein
MAATTPLSSVHWSVTTSNDNDYDVDDGPPIVTNDDCDDDIHEILFDTAHNHLYGNGNNNNNNNNNGSNDSQSRGSSASSTLSTTSLLWRRPFEYPVRDESLMVPRNDDNGSIGGGKPNSRPVSRGGSLNRIKVTSPASSSPSRALKVEPDISQPRFIRDLMYLIKSSN